MERLRKFLRPHGAATVRRASTAIVRSLQKLVITPNAGRVAITDGDEVRELVIEFGSSGYVALYQIENDAIVVLAIRHQKEAGY
jgi:plasmid stabilization system protein ParE